METCTTTGVYWWKPREPLSQGLARAIATVRRVLQVNLRILATIRDYGQWQAL